MIFGGFILKNKYKILSVIMCVITLIPIFATGLTNQCTNAANITDLNSNIVFVIGGSLGLSEEVKERSNYALSFSKLTFPHQLFRIILLEQIYRAFKIINNESYHK